MKIKKKDQYFTAVIEFSEVEIQSLVGLFEDYARLKCFSLSPDSDLGLREEIYTELVKLLPKA